MCTCALEIFCNLLDIIHKHLADSGKCPKALRRQNLDYVQEFGEGVDRMYKEMEKAGQPTPEYKDVAFMLHATIRNGINVVDNVADSVVDNVADSRNKAFRY